MQPSQNPTRRKTEMNTYKKFEEETNKLGSIIDSRGRDGLLDVARMLQVEIGTATVAVTEHDSPQGQNNNLKNDLRQAERHLERIEVLAAALVEATVV